MKYLSASAFVLLACLAAVAVAAPESIPIGYKHDSNVVQEQLERLSQGAAPLPEVASATHLQVPLLIEIPVKPVNVVNTTPLFRFKQRPLDSGATSGQQSNESESVLDPRIQAWRMSYAGK